MTPRNIPATSSSPRPAARLVQTPPPIPARIAALHRRLTGLDAADLPELFLAAPRAGSSAVPHLLQPTRWHALVDAEACLVALVDLRRLIHSPSAAARAGSLATQAEGLAPPLRPAADVHAAIEPMQARIAAICAAAGLQTPEAVSACHRVVRSVALYMLGVAGHAFGKTRQRRLAAIRTDAERILSALPRLHRSARADAQARRSRAYLGRASTAIDPLQALLPRLIGNASRMLDELELAAPGGAAVPDPVPYGAECALAIWIRHHPRVPNLSTNRGGFLAFGDDLLNLSVEALGPIRPAWLHRTTLNTALRDQVKLFRCAARS